MQIISASRNTEQTISFAEQELRRYLGQMVAQETVFSIFLELEPEEDRDVDRFTVHAGQDRLSIRGSNPRSVLLGAYDYLHHLGCRFLSPAPRAEITPAVSVSDLPASYSKQASFAHRGVCIEGGNSLENVLAFVDWLPKVGYNSFFLQFKVPYAFFSRWYRHEKNPYAQPEDFSMEDALSYMKIVEREVQKRGLLLHKVGHGWTGEVLCGTVHGSWDAVEDQLRADKQMLCAQVDGKREFWRGVPTNTNLCFSNPRAVDDFARLVVDYARENPNVDHLHIWLADEYNNVCQCPSCRTTTITDQYVSLLNEIDRRLTDLNLPTRLVFLLYQELLWPPVRQRLNNPERFLMMFAPISRTFEASYDLSDIPSEIEAYVPNKITLPTALSQNLAFLRSWQRVFPGQGFVYDYPLGRAHYGDFGYVHIARIISQDIQKLDQLGLNGYISCQELRAAMPNSLPNYVMGRTLMDASLSVETLIQEYFQAAYPEQPETARRILEQLSAWSSCDYLNGKGPRIDPEMARRYEQIADLCSQELQKNYPRGSHWAVLRYHLGYVLRLSRALAALASGNNRLANEEYLQMRQYICQGEKEYQPWLDVYRILEVTQKYTGFQIS